MFLGFLRDKIRVFPGKKNLMIYLQDVLQGIVLEDISFQ